MKLVEVLGKQNRKVPVLLTPDMATALQVLTAKRDAAGVCKTNPYVFASVSIIYLNREHYKLDSRLLCNARGASRLAKRYYILITALELTLQGQPRSNVVVQITR